MDYGEHDCFTLQPTPLSHGLRGRASYLGFVLSTNSSKHFLQRIVHRLEVVVRFDFVCFHIGKSVALALPRAFLAIAISIGLGLVAPLFAILEECSRRIHIDLEHFGEPLGTLTYEFPSTPDILIGDIFLG